MGYKFEDKLRRRAEQFIEQIRIEGFHGQVVEDSFRDYTVKVAVSCDDTSMGKVSLYYSPKSDSFSLKTNELKDKSVIPRLEDVWRAGSSREERPHEERPHEGRSPGESTG